MEERFKMISVSLSLVVYSVCDITPVISCLQKLQPTDRSNLLDDAFNLARAEILSYDLALNMTLYLDKETDYVPWDTAGNGFFYLSNMLKFTGDYGLLQVSRDFNP